MDGLATEQYEIGAEIAKLKTNLGKEPKERRTEDLINRRRKTLLELWNKFSEKHKQIQAFDDDDHDYFQKNFYEQVRKAADEANAIIERYASECKQTTATPHKQTSSSTSGSTSAKTAENINNDKTALTPEVLSLVKRAKYRMEIFNEMLDENDDSAQNSLLIDFNIKKLTTYWNNIENLHEEIMTTIEANDWQMSEIKTTIQMYKWIKNKFNSILNKNEENKLQSDIKLPTLTIPSFDGKYESWISFHDMFVKIIHTNNKLANVERMQYLKTHVKGEASRLLSHLDISDANYETAWKLITERYNNVRKMVSTHIQTILSIPKIDNESPNALKKLLDTTKNVYLQFLTYK